MQDLRTDRTDPTGVFSAYMDLFYDKNLSTVRVAEIQSIQLTGTNEIQTITRGTDATNLQFSFNGVNSTGNQLATWNSATLVSSVQAKLRTIPALGTNGANVAVAGPAGGPFTVTYLGNLGSSNVAFQVIPSIAAAATVTTTQEGGGDTFTLTLNGNTTPNIPFRTPAGAGSDVVLAANATAIQNALNTMLAPQFGPNTVQVDLIGGTNYSVWFNGEYDVNFNKMVAAVTGGAAAAVTVKDASDNTPTVPGTFINVDGDKTIKDTVAPFRDSFAEAFRTRTISVGGVVTATPGEFQKDLDARDEADHIGEVGAFAESFNPLGAGTFFEVVRVRMQAILPVGQTMATQVFNPFLGDPATYPNDGLERPAHNTLTYANPGESTLVLPEFIAFNEDIELLITSGPITADNFSVNVDENALNVPINVLANVTDNPGDPANPVIELVPGSVVKVSGSGTVTQNGNNVTFSTSGDLTDSTVFTYTARVQGDTDPNRFATATATININAINDAPDITGPGAQNVQEGVANTTINFGATAFNVTDVDVATGDMTLTLTEASAAFSQITISILNLNVNGNGTNSVTATGKIADINAALDTVQYVNTSQVGGNFSLVASISDLGNTGNGGTLTDSVTVAINITSVNDAPTLTAPGNVAVAFVDTLTFNGPNAITVADVDSNNLTVTLAVSGGVGTLAAIPANGAIVTNSGTTNLTITGSPTAITNTLAGMVLTPPPGNTNVLTGAIAVSASDGVAPAATANIVVNVIPPNLPFAINDTPQGLVEGSASYTVDVLLNDLTNDPTNRDPVLVSFTQPMRGGQQVGTVTQDFGPGQSSGSNTNLFDDKLVFNVPLLSGNPDLNFFTPPGQDITFTYVMNEGPTSGGVDATATVTIRIANQADAPVATNDNYATTVNTPLTISDVNEGVLRRDTDDSTIDNNYGDPNFATLSVLIDGSNPATRTTSQGGSVTINANGTFVYTPQTGDIGNDTFTYQAVSSAGGSPSAPATVTIKIASPPVVTNSTVVATEDVNLPISIAANYTDPTEMLPLGSVQIVTNVPANTGAVTVAPDGISFIYDPADNFNTSTPFSFTYRALANDGRQSNVATVSITVNEVNDAPTAANDTFTAVRQQSGIGIDQPVAVLGNDSFAPDVGETLVVTGISASMGGPFVTTATATGAGNGASVRVSNGQILYTSPTVIPGGGTDTFFYQITDRATGGLTAVARVDVTIVDFVPKTISGTVYIDDDNDGVFDAGETPLAGVTVRLTGNSFDNQSVLLNAVTDQQGRYVFPQKPNEPGVVDTAVFLKPPSAAGYTITEIDPFGFISGIDFNSTGNSLITNSSAFDNIFVAKWPVADNSGNITGLNFGEAGIDFRPVGEGGTLINAGGFKHEFLSSSGGNGFVLALDVSGNLMWNWTLDDPNIVGVAWENAKSIHAVLSSDLTTLTLTVRDGQNQSFTRVLTQGYSIPGSTARFRILASGVAGQYIVRVDASANGASDGLGMILLAAAPAAMAGAEGEAPVNADYANSADAVYAEGAWA